MTKIIITTGGIPALKIHGGVASYVHELANNLCDRGYDVIVYVFRENLEENIIINEKYACKLYRIPSKRADEKYLVLDILKEIEKNNPDIIINNEISYIAGLMPVINKDIIKISINHGFLPHKTLSTLGMEGRIATYNWQWIDWIICQNSQMANGIIKKYGVSKDRVIYISQTSKIEEIPILESNKTFTIVYAGGDSKHKGSQEMKSICKKLKNSDMNFKLIWCLTANSVKEEFINDNRFIFSGKLNRNDFIKTLNNADCIIIPSHMDTGPMLLVEAMSVGTIPICNNLSYSAIPDIIKNGINGYCINDNCVDKYFEVINELYINRDKVSKIKNATYNYYLENLAPEHQIKNFVSIFRKNSRNVAESVEFKEKHIIHCTLKYNTANLPKYSTTRLSTKILNFLEVVVTEPIYKTIIKYFIK